MNRQEIIEQAQAAVADWHGLLGESGLTPQACFERLRRLGGEEAVRKVQREVEESVRAIEERIRRDVLHATPNRAVSRYVAQRGGI